MGLVQNNNPNLSDGVVERGGNGQGNNTGADRGRSSFAAIAFGRLLARFPQDHHIGQRFREVRVESPVVQPFNE